MIPRSIKLASESHIPLQIALTGRAQMLRTTVRHTRLVRFLRYAIPTGAAAVAFVIFVALRFSSSHLFSAFPVDPGKVSLSGTRITMEFPRVSGYTADFRRYQLTARAAVQDMTKPDILELKELEAEIDLEDGQHVTVRSVNGIYDTKREVLKLSDDIVLKSTSGYEGYFSEATIDVATSNVVSESHVLMKLPNDGLLNADRLRAEQNGDVIIFSGGVEVTFNPEQPSPASQEAPSSSASSTKVSVRQQPTAQPPRHARKTSAPVPQH